MRDARYVRLISWTLQSGSEQLILHSEITLLIQLSSLPTPVRFKKVRTFCWFPNTIVFLWHKAVNTFLNVLEKFCVKGKLGKGHDIVQDLLFLKDDINTISCSLSVWMHCLNLLPLNKSSYRNLTSLYIFPNPKSLPTTTMSIKHWSRTQRFKILLLKIKALT